jgi:hypothetical protein
MKVVLAVTWLLGFAGQPATMYQIEFESLELCNKAAEAVRADAARLDKERADEVEAALERNKTPEMSAMFSALSGRQYAVSAVCLVTSTGP